MGVVIKCFLMIFFFLLNDYYCYCVWIVLVEKGVIVDIVDVDNGDKLEDLVLLNFYNEVFILVDWELILYQFMVIMEYLDECFLYLLLLLVYLVVRVQSCLLIYCVECDWCVYVDVLLVGIEKEVVLIKCCKELCEVMIVIVLIFSELLFFMSEEFILVDCVVGLILWWLLVLGIELLFKQVKLLLDYVEWLFDCDVFQVSFFEVECELCQL